MLQYDPETVDSLSGQQMIMMTRLGAACTHAHGVVHGSPHRPEQACAGPPDVSASSEKRYEESDEFEDIASSWVIIDARALSPSSASSASLVMSTRSHPHPSCLRAPAAHCVRGLLRLPCLASL